MLVVATASMAGQSPAWFTPERLLFLFCCMSLLVYLDRGASRSQRQTAHMHLHSLSRLPVRLLFAVLLLPQP